MDYQFLTTLGVNVIGLGVLIYQVVLMRRQIAGRTIANKKSGWFKLYWPLLAMLPLLGSTWIPYFLAPNAAPQYFMTWSPTPNGGAVATIDASLLANHRGSRRIILVGIVMDSSIDPMNETHIAKSRTYEIEPPAMVLEVLGAPGFLAQEQPGRNVQWYLLEVPENFAIERLVTLADVSHLGGTILGHEGFITSGMPSVSH
jgi:hypothetical protein